MIYPIDVYERVANRKKLVGADRNSFFISLFLMCNFFVFIILHRVLVVSMGLPLAVCILVQILIFIIFGILIFRYVIFDEESKMREYSDENSDSFARFMHLRKDATHEIRINKKSHVNVFEYDNGCVTCTMRFKFGSNDNYKSKETRQCLNEIFRVLTNNNLEFRTISDPENFRKSQELDNYIYNINNIEDKALAKHILAMSDEIIRRSYEECNVDQLYLSFRTPSSYQLEDCETVIRHILKIISSHITCFRSVEFLDLNQLLDFYRDFYPVEAIDLAMMRAIELSETLDENFSEIVKVVSLRSDSNKLYKTSMQDDSLLISGEVEVNRVLNNEQE